MASRDRTTIVFALVANLAIAVAKAVGGAVSGSAAMFAEAAHSVADTTNQIFLLVSLTLGARPSDEGHPFGYGKERFFWSFLAAAFIFVSGAVFSIFLGIHEVVSGAGAEGGFLLNYGILAVSVVAESASWVRAWRHVREQAREAGTSLARFIGASRDPTVKTVLSEDSAALVGLGLAFAGVALQQATGDPRWGGYASIAIGVLLAVVAVVLGRDIKGLLIGEAASPQERRAIHEVIERQDEIAEIIELLTMAIGPDSVLVAVKVALRGDASGADIERVSKEIDARVHAVVPAVTEVFLDPTPRR